MEFRVTDELLWRGAFVFAVLDVPFAFMLGRKTDAERLRAIRNTLIGVTALYWAGLWFVMALVYWETVYVFVFPAWSRWFLPLFQALLACFVVMIALSIARRVQFFPLYSFLLTWGLWGIVTHVWAFFRGISSRPPGLRGAGLIPIVGIAFFEFTFYACICTTLALLIHSVRTRIRKWPDRLFKHEHRVEHFSTGKGD